MFYTVENDSSRDICIRKALRKQKLPYKHKTCKMIEQVQSNLSSVVRFETLHKCYTKLQNP